MKVKTFGGLKKNSLIYYTADGYYYYKNRIVSGGRLSLVCRSNRNGLCPGRASCEADGTDAKVTIPHDHPSDKSFFRKRQLRSAILDRCRSKDPRPYHEIVAQESDGYSRAVKMENHHNKLRCSMRRARLDKYPNVPATLGDLGRVLRKKKHRNITATKDTKDNVFFGCVGSSSQNTRCVIFMSKRQLARLKKAKKIFADGTFNSRPAKPMSRQVYTLSTCTKDRRGLPLAVVLMQSKSEEAYTKLLETLKDCGLQPRVVHTDFELAQYKSWKNVFGQHLKVDGCLFHYVVRLKKKARNLRLSRFLKENARADSIVQSCNALPLLAHHRMRAGLRTIELRAQRSGLRRRLRPFFSYIRRTWLPRCRILSVCHSEDRTNNISETWNKILTLAVKQKGPNIWIFIDALVKLEEQFAQDLYNIKRGMRVNRLRKTSAIRNDNMIRQLTGSLMVGDISLSVFLQSASHRMANVWNAA